MSEIVPGETQSGASQNILSGSESVGSRTGTHCASSDNGGGAGVTPGEASEGSGGKVPWSAPAFCCECPP